MKQLLILGGTNFIGRCLVEELLKSGDYVITLFNRQKTNPELFPEVEKIKGDRRTDDVRRLSEKRWDAVVDLSAYYPEPFEHILQYINTDLDAYVFISTCSVYNNEANRSPLKSESDEVLGCTADQRLSQLPDAYGEKKAECERILMNSNFRYTILRPALVYGKYDPTDRLYYWMYQARHNSEVLVPDNGERTFSVTYVYDLVASIVAALKSPEQQKIYNVTTDPQTSIANLVKYSAELTNKTVSHINASPEFLKENNIGQWVDMPLWIDGDYFTYNNEALLRETTVQPTDFRKSMKETIRFYEEQNWPVPGYGIDEEKRQQLLDRLSS